MNDSFGWKGTVWNGEYGSQCGRGYKVFCCEAGNMNRYLDICTWSECNEGCPDDKPHVLTTDTGGPKSNSRCLPRASGGGVSPSDPAGGTAGTRKLCCPKEDSFKSCEWSSKKVCSATCGINQVTLDLDQRGPDPKSGTCDNGREKAFCCDPPGGRDRPFTPFNMENLFPYEYLPPADAIPSYQLISFGGGYAAPTGEEDPDSSGVAFFLIAGGSDISLTSMKKRDNPGLHFLSCPKDVLQKPNEHHQVARVICLDEDVSDCFRVRNGGVEGTVVQMPDECGGSSFARAVSLTRSKNQSVSSHLSGAAPDPTVYDFTFDYNIPLVRRDGGDFSIRMDYSNVPGYWNAIVDSPGANAKKRDLHELVERFYGDNGAWEDAFNSLELSTKAADSIDFEIKQLIYDNNESCPADDGKSESIDEGISVGVLGRVKADVYYGFSMIATWNPSDEINVRQAAGFVRPEGETDAIFKVGGRGGIDTSRSFQGSSMRKAFDLSSTMGHTVFKGWAWFQGYQETGVSLETSGGDAGMVSLSGFLEGRVQSEWGRAYINFPVGAAGELAIGTGERQRRSDGVSASDEIKLENLDPSLKGTKGSILASSTIRIGLQVGLAFPGSWENAVPGSLPDMSVSQEVAAKFSIDNTQASVCVRTSLGTIQKSHLSHGSSVGWKDKDEKEYVRELTEAGSQKCFDRRTESKRNVDSETPEDLEIESTTALTIRPGGDMIVKRADRAGSKPNAVPRLHDVAFAALHAALRCDKCISCVQVGGIDTPCCGCACLSCKYGFEEDVRETSEARENTALLKRELHEVSA